MTEHALVPATGTQVRDELTLPDPYLIGVDPETDIELLTQAEKYADMLINFNPEDAKASAQSKHAVEIMGVQLQRQAAHRSQMLQEPIRKLSERSVDGGEIANALVELKMQVEELDPSQIDFQPGWVTRLFGWLPFIGNPLKRYFSRYESAQTVIDAIVRSLEQGREQLRRDNITLADDQAALRDITLRLEKSVKLGQLIDQSLESRLDSEIRIGDSRYPFIQEELLFPLRQRIQDLQQQLAVSQQGILAMELVIRNNNELMRGVNRANSVTVSALQVAVTVAMALADQKIVLDKITTLNTTTSDLISGTAARLKTQGTQIHKMASQSQLDMNALKSAFADIQAAMDDIAHFRQVALPQMAETILEMDKITTESGRMIEKLEQGNQAQPELVIEV
ncbi:toxic anion resistance protein [Candidatus Entotheonella palauensis]|uniref:toxic anion resistance protein n=1 Tax=Candidatus Entotheonella palauensis TaxID=93172 RepID=UPI0015C4C9AC|nr:toxic anion resistance protein [Candidatus Entotheonella palauensis]